MKMKKFLSSLLLLLFITGCTSSSFKKINILTDEPLVYEIADEFNSNLENIKVSVEFINNKTFNDSSKNILKYFEENRQSNYDIIIGDYNPESMVDLDLFTSMNNSHILINNNKVYFNSFRDYIEKYNWKIMPFSMNFNVLIARRDILPKEYLYHDELSMDEFFKLIKRTNKKDLDSQYNRNYLSFIPALSRIKELDFYYLLNKNFFEKNEKVHLRNSDFEKSFLFYRNFNDNYNFGNETAKKYIERYKNVNANFLLKQKVVSFEIMPIGEALSYSEDAYKIFLIKENQLLTLSGKITAVPDSSIRKAESLIFLNYLYSGSIQERLFLSTQDNQDFYNYIFIPAVKGIMKKSTLRNIGLKKLEEHLDKIEYPTFYNLKFQKKFFQKYAVLKDSLNKGQLSEKDFTGRLANEIIK